MWQVLWQYFIRRSLYTLHGYFKCVCADVLDTIGAIESVSVLSSLQPPSSPAALRRNHLIAAADSQLSSPALSALSTPALASPVLGGVIDEAPQVLTLSDTSSPRRAADAAPASEQGQHSTIVSDSDADAATAADAAMSADALVRHEAALQASVCAATAASDAEAVAAARARAAASASNARTLEKCKTRFC